MHAATDRLEFAPPQPPGMLRALVLAIAAHLLLMLALTWGINWKRDAEVLSAEAELWSSVPQQAAPKLVEPPAPLPAPPVPQPPQPVEKVVPPPPAEPLPLKADIALEQERQKQAEEKAMQLAVERKKREEQKKKQEQALRRAAEEKQKQELAKKKVQEERQQQELAKRKAQEDRLKQEAADRAREQTTARRVEAQRQENLRRMQGLAGATGAPTATGTAPRSAGPSDSYAGRIRARVKPNIVFAEDIAGNPTADVEVRTSPDGTIIGQRITKSSGVRAWDEAVVKAIIKTEVLPRDVDGRVHSPLIISFRPKDF